MKKTTLLLTLTLAACGPEDTINTQSDALSSNDRVLSGCYSPRLGGIRALAFSPTEALGQYHLLLQHQGWAQLSAEQRRQTRRRFFLSGPIRGAQDPATQLAAHVQGTRDRSGFLFTDGDTFTPSNNDCALQGVQTLNYVAGSGALATLSSGTVALEGTINTCPTDPAFGRVDLRVLSGTICFSP